MSARLGILTLFALAACGPLPGPANSELMATDAGPPRSSACATDGDCSKGMICEGCPDGFFTCVPGCREDAQCGANMICNTQVQCLSCPCPSGYCDLDPCRDLDGDGYAALETGVCPGKQVGDCNDGAPSVHPGAREVCANGQDDDCDGRRDARDDACRDSCTGSRFCAYSYYCGSNAWCDRGCCEFCADVVTPTCSPGQCLTETGLDANGCRQAPRCTACPTCSNDYAPVCGKNFATYTNECWALAAGTTVLHTGPCARNEGARCEGPNECPYGQYCRDLGTSKQCTLAGSCSVDADCRYVTQVVSCGDAGVASYVCRNERCSPQCP